MSELTAILVVDDESEIRDMLEEYLSKQGFAVCTADGGAAMRQIVSARTVDVVLLDIRMPRRGWSKPGAVPPGACAGGHYHDDGGGRGC